MASLDDLAVKRGAVDNGEFSDDSGADSAKDSFNESDFDDTDTDAITELDANAEIEVLDRQAEECDLAGDPVKALYYREQALVRRQETDVGDEEFGDFCYLLAVQYNSVAMSQLREEKSKEALTMLKKAEVLTAAKGLFRSKLHRAKLRALTFNNFGCVFKFCGQLHTALRYLDKALHIEAMFSACDNPAGTHLNVCAILSQMGRHRGALHHADFALEILTAERLVKRAQKRDKERDAKIRRLRRQRAAEGGGGDDAGAGAGGWDGSPGVGGAQQGDESHIAMYSDGEADGASVGGDTVGTARDTEGTEKASLLAIAHYNRGVELEHLKQSKDAVKAYKSAFKFAREDLGPEHPMTAGIKATLRQATHASQAAAKKKKQGGAGAPASGRAPATSGARQGKPRKPARRRR